MLILSDESGPHQRTNPSYEGISPLLQKSYRIIIGFMDVKSCLDSQVVRQLRQELILVLEVFGVLVAQGLLELLVQA